MRGDGIKFPQQLVAAVGKKRAALMMDDRRPCFANFGAGGRNSTRRARRNLAAATLERSHLLCTTANGSVEIIMKRVERKEETYFALLGAEWAAKLLRRLPSDAIPQRRYAAHF